MKYLSVKTLKPILYFLLFVFLFFESSTIQAQKQEDNNKDQATVIFLVRHAEQEKEWKGDPPLNAQGKARTALLTSVLSKSPLSAVYATHVLRATSTAAPLLEANGLELTTYKLEDDETQLVKTILKKHAGKNILIIGHSGNIAELLNAATSSKKYDDKAVDQFNDLYIISFVGNHAGMVTRLNYGQ